MAPILVKNKNARGHRDKHKTNASEMSDNDQSLVDEIMTPEDMQLLKGVDDDDDVSDVEIDAGGNNVSESEINSFLQKLNVNKYRPFPVSESANKHQSKDKNNRINMNARSDVQNVLSKKDRITKEVSQVPISNDHTKTSKKEVSKNKSVTNSQEVKAVMKFLETYKSRKHLLLKPEEMWREEQVHPLAVMPPDEKLVREAENLAKRLLEDEVSTYSKQREQSKRSEARWLKTVLASGTLSDKMAALTLLIQESPVHNMASIDSLISMARKKGRREAMMAVDTLRDMFLTGLLPDDRKLRAFEQQPLMKLLEMTSGNIDVRDKYIVMWYFEGLVKKKYADFIKALGDMSFDTLQATKEKALSSIHQLLTSKPEQENSLLPMLVNKLGDPAIKSKATYLLTKLVDEHPNMKHVIVREVQQLLHRPNVSERAQYYAICFLAQLKLTHTNSDLASQLIQIYFFFFQTYLTKGDIDNKMMSALLTGVNRAYVFAKDNKEKLAEQMDAVYKIIPSVNFHTSVQALMLLYQVSSASTNASDRYYTCLYRKLIDPALRNSSKQAIFMNLLFKSMKTDIVDKRIKAFVKRTLQVYCQQPAQVISAVLIHLSQLLKDKPGLLDTKHTAREIWSDDEDEKFVDLPVPEEFDSPRKNHEHNNGKLDDDQSESDEVQTKKEQKNSGSGSTQNGVKGSWIHRVNYGGGGHLSDYDPYNRNPAYAKAEQDCLWELMQLIQHYHPTVRMYASSVLQGKHFEYDGDPLQDYTLIRFLDRFVYKNPKKESTNTSIGHFKKQGPSGIRAIPVNSKEFLEIGEESVPEDEKFFYRYFTEKVSRKKDTGSDADSDGASIADDEFDAYLDGFEKDVDKDDDFGEMDLDFAGLNPVEIGVKVEVEYFTFLDSIINKGGVEKYIKQRDTNKSKPKEKRKKVEYSDDESVDLDLEDEELAAEFQQEMEGMDVGDDFDDDDDYSDEIEDEIGTHKQTVSLLPNDRKKDSTRKIKIASEDSGRKRKKQQMSFTDFETDDIERPQKKVKNKHDTTDLFASAEQFAHLLEEGTESGQVSLGGTGDLRNKDKAAQKQLKWESERDRWLTGNKAQRHEGYRKKDVKGGGKRGTESYAKNKFSKNRERKNFGKKFQTGKKKFQHKKK